ncbi:MAG: RNA polymerase sigma factor, partial [Actinomycetota bacterium]
MSTPDPRLQAEMDDKSLVLSFQTGQRPGAYREIYERYEPRVQSVCKRMLACPEDAEEACQETFMRVYQSLGKFNGRYQLGAWMSRIATNVCLDMIRTKKRRPSEPRDIEDLEHEAVAPETEGDPEWTMLRRVNAETVRSILDSLPSMHRRAIVLRDFDGLSYGDIATRLSITEKQTKALLHRARKNFRRSWTGGSIASLLLPERILSKLRRLPRLDEASTRSPSAISDVVGSVGNFVSSCSAVVQQCGQMAVERFAGTAMAIVVGTAAVGAPVIAHTATKPHHSEGRASAQTRPVDVAEAITALQSAAPVRN